jgi:hypothetical protein
MNVSFAPFEQKIGVHQQIQIKLPESNLLNFFFYRENYCWYWPAQSFLVPRPARLITIFYSLTSLWIFQLCIPKILLPVYELLYAKQVDIPTNYHGEANRLVRELSLILEEAFFFETVVKFYQCTWRHFT